MKTIPLVIDLDGTLIRSDLLLESALLFLRTHPFAIIKLFIWLMRGKAYLKARLALNVKIDVASLPYEQQVLHLIHSEKAQGRILVLATASHKIYAQAIANHLRCFDQIFATDEAHNLSAANKSALLQEQFGVGGFDYAGNSNDDVVVWQAARLAYVVNPEAGVAAKAQKLGNVQQVIITPSSPLKLWIKACRLHQWMKNALLFVPLLAAHQADRLDLLLDGVLAFIFFGFCASSVYLLNDLLDLADDRHHATKRQRPFAAGSLSIKAGLILFPTLLVAAFLGSWYFLPLKFAEALVIYYILTLAYSLVLKRLMAIDAITLAALYTLRIIAGTAVFDTSLTFWLLAFSMFMFLSLALVKRYTEMRIARAQGKTVRARGRGYYPEDLEMLSALGAAAGYLAVLVLALYIQDLNTIALYHYPRIIWLACPLLLYWITRVWLLAHRGQIHDDPVVFALKDRASLAMGVLFGFIFWLAI